MKIKKSELIKAKGITDNQVFDLSDMDKENLDKLNNKLTNIITKKYIKESQ